jgi:hypothetical protein
VEFDELSNGMVDIMAFAVNSSLRSCWHNVGAAQDAQVPVLYQLRTRGSLRFSASAAFISLGR